MRDNESVTIRHDTSSEGARMSVHWQEVNMTNALLHLSLAGFALGAAGGAIAAQGTPDTPLRPLAECLDPDRARGWTSISDKEIMVDTGRDKFFLRFPKSCSDLNFTPVLRFRPSVGSTRICGHSTDAVLGDSRGGVAIPCTISSIVSIDSKRYRELRDASPDKKIDSDDVLRDQAPRDEAP
jgi:hypothetical protein